MNTLCSGTVVGSGTITAVSTYPLCALLYKLLLISTSLSYISHWQTAASYDSASDCSPTLPLAHRFSLLYVSSFMYLASACLRMSQSLPRVVREGCGDVIHLASPLRTNDKDRLASRLFKSRARDIVHSARLSTVGLRKATGGRYFLNLIFSV